MLDGKTISIWSELVAQFYPQPGEKVKGFECLISSPSDAF